MILKETNLSGVFILEPKRFDDERGFFAPAWSEIELANRGVESRFIEGNISYNHHRGTLRGVHYQAAPFGQAKLVRCTRGSMFDVGIDLRPHSPTFKQWVGVELSAENRLMLYLPGDFAHGYLTLEDQTEVYYQVSQVYVPEANRGVLWDDPAFAIEWPRTEELTINERDRTFLPFTLQT
jgi:dTDP-4-dehydrorhamnose 3,5-epimerase